MKKIGASLSAAALACLLASSTPQFAQVVHRAPQKSHAYTPESSLPQPPNARGQIMANTHLRILLPSATQRHFGAAAVQPNELPPFAGYLFETPASLACVYSLVKSTVRGCNPNATTANPTGGSHAIAIVDAFDDPTAASDLAVFSAQFGLPPADLTVVYAQGAEPAVGPSAGWEIEEALDTQWAHAMAPNAKLYLVEAANNSFTNLFGAVIVASNLVAGAGGGEVSMSWGSGEEFAGEASLDSFFTAPGVVYVASSGDAPGVQYPSASPNVISAGGTTISRDLNTGNLILENAWQDAGSGVSQVEPRPKFQNGVSYLVGNGRGTPDLAFDSNPNTGVWVFDTNTFDGTGWFIVGGTSVAAPSLAGIINAAGGFRASSAAENQEIYSRFGRGFNDILYGNCGPNISDFSLPGYDLCTGVGSVHGLEGK
ncbi:MAG TPA: S53 family peptidase [Terracidiphilus sp.]|nr:S53 family peptidase [Terracidiphilus sp.]